MRIKRVLQGTALTALAAAAWMGAGSDASASVNKEEICLSTSEDSGAYVLSVEVDSTDLELMAGVAKVAKNGGKAKVSAWDVYETNSNTSVEIDLSKLNVANDNYIAVKTDDMPEPIFVGIAAAAKKTSVKLNGETAKIKEMKVNNNAYTGDIEIRTSNGDNWAGATINEDFSKYQYQGATLYVRVPAQGYDAEKKSPATANTKVIDITDDKNNTKELDVFQVGSLPGKEAKLNIAKQANGPKVTVDYVKGTVKIPKDSEVRMVTTDIATAAAFNKQTEIKTVTPGALLGTAQKGVLEVRKASSNKGNGKPASKWTRVALTQPESLTVGPVSSVNSTGTAVYSTNVSNGSVEFKYNLNSKKNPTGITLENKVGVSIDYSIGEPKADGTGFKAIKKDNKVTLKISGTSSVDGKDIYVRLSGIKTSKTWAGEWKKVATISVPK